MEQIKIPFFKRMKRAIFNPEAYSTFIIEKTSESIKYFFKFLIIFVIIISIGYTYYLYTQGFNEENISLLKQAGFNEEYIEQALKAFEETNDMYLITILFSISLFTLYTVFSISTLLDICIFAALGWISARICGMKIKYKQCINISIYAITLPSILLAIYIIANQIFGINIEYFTIAYDAITYVYIITAILMLRADVIKQRIELAKIMKEQEKVREEFEKQKDQTKDKENKEDDEPKEEGEPEGNKA